MECGTKSQRICQLVLELQSRPLVVPVLGAKNSRHMDGSSLIDCRRTSRPRVRANRVSPFAGCDGRVPRLTRERASSPRICELRSRARGRLPIHGAHHQASPALRVETRIHTPGIEVPVRPSWPGSWDPSIITTLAQAQMLVAEYRILRNTAWIVRHAIRPAQQPSPRSPRTPRRVSCGLGSFSAIPPAVEWGREGQTWTSIPAILPRG